MPATTHPAGAIVIFRLGGGLIEPHDRPWGIYSGYFRDPDGHLWEVIHNPPRTGSTG